MPTNILRGSSAFLSVLQDEGVTHLFGNPGTTELPVMDALKRHPDLTYVLGLQEAIVVAMADGFSRASGRLVACNVHVAPGLGNAMGSVYNAKFTRPPLLVTAGQQLVGKPGTTERPVRDARKREPDRTDGLGLQESRVVAMADGFSRGSGRLVGCNGHVAPGLGNAMGSIYNAKFTRTPMIVTAGQQEVGHGLTEPLLYDPLV